MHFGKSLGFNDKSAKWPVLVFGIIQFSPLFGLSCSPYKTLETTALRLTAFF